MRQLQTQLESQAHWAQLPHVLIEQPPPMLFLQEQSDSPISQAPMAIEEKSSELPNVANANDTAMQYAPNNLLTFDIATSGGS